jgi:protein-tyrosine phosphatase
MKTNLQEPQLERLVKLEGAYNLRDLGGYKTKDGNVTKWGRFYRADGLHKLTEADQRTVLDRNIRLVVDLRHTDELQKDPNVFAASEQVAYHNVSLINPATVASTNSSSLGELYVGMLDESQSQIREVMDYLANGPGDALLYHCTAGKDRTGVISALLLDTAGVPHDVIVNDYSMTAECLAPMIDEIRQKHLGSMTQEQSEKFERFMGCASENMVIMLEHLYNRYESAEKYLLAIGLTEAQIDTLKRKLLV